MYRYDEFDRRFVRERVAQFREQIARRLAGALSEEEFRPLRLMNGLYLQLHAYMLRVAIPYGVLSSRQLEMLASISERYDKSYGHFTTRQNIQFNWPRLPEVPEILSELASVEMHAIQTSGNCVRNVTSDPFAGACLDEIADPRPVCEWIRQWSSLHAEFSYLPRKFKIAVTGARADRAAVRFHDTGLVYCEKSDQKGFEVWIGGGQGRTPRIAVRIRDFLPEEELLLYLQAILRVYNRYGRRDNRYKARIKILVHEKGTEAIQSEIETEFAFLKESGSSVRYERGANGDWGGVSAQELQRITQYFAPPEFASPRGEKNADWLLGGERGLARICALGAHQHSAP